MSPDHLPATDASRAASAATGAAPVASHGLPLHSRNIGVLCDDPLAAESILLRQAALDLGARVALVRSDLDATSSAVELAHTARVLGRLYDAVLCVNLAPAIVDALRVAAGVPVIADESGAGFDGPAAGQGALDTVRGLLLAQLAAL